MRAMGWKHAGWKRAALTQLACAPRGWRHAALTQHRLSIWHTHGTPPCACVRLSGSTTWALRFSPGTLFSQSHQETRLVRKLLARTCLEKRQNVPARTFLPELLSVSKAFDRSLTTQPPPHNPLPQAYPHTRLATLEQLKLSGMITPEEYCRKRQEIIALI